MTTTLIARTPDDLLAAIPIVLGFHPERSIVMLTLAGPQRFHARLDLPAEPADLAVAVDALLQPAIRNGVEQVAFVLYSPDRLLVRSTAEVLVGAFVEAGIDVLDCLRADEGRWYPASSRRRGRGHPYDPEQHPFRAQAVFDGHVMYQSRGELAAQVGSDAAAAAVVADLLADAEPLDGPALWDLIDRHLADETVPTDRETAVLLVSLADEEARDHGWRVLDRAAAPGHVRLWSDVLRRAPETHVAEVASVLAIAAWLSGNGALAWCALDRCFAVAPHHRLALLLARALSQAVPPTVWDR